MYTSAISNELKFNVNTNGVNKSCVLTDKNQLQIAVQMQPVDFMNALDLKS